MDKTKKNTKNKSLSLQMKLSTYKHYFSPDMAAELRPQDVRKIRQISAGEVADISRGDRIKAFQLMSYIGRLRECEILGKVIANHKEDSDLRAAAATHLAKFAPKLAEKELLKHLKIKNALIRSKIIKSLGMIGGPEAYMSLSRLKNIRTDFLKKQLDFAKALIAYRHNIDADPLPFIEGVKRRRKPREELLQLSVKPAGNRKLIKALKNFEGNNYGIKLAQSTGFEVTAGKAKWMLFINKQSDDIGIIMSISSRKMIIGLLSRWIRETETYSTQYVVLTKPTKDNEIQIMVLRSDGEILYSGKTVVEKNILSFIVSDIKRLGTAPTRVRGKLTARGLELEVSIPVSKREGKRMPRTIKSGDLHSKFAHMIK